MKGEGVVVVKRKKKGQEEEEYEGTCPKSVSTK
jgi:hypothetical protein